ncbi:plasmid partitioning protein RepB [Methylobacterium indicum]|uniref:Plasmid partitioning protein RepB n=1 Tax=Methylobacterium indicum TaxID=1775910 RepID=A0A8H8X0L3_9HYPH|nr:plasmid partitioning protein RepB [Methylobacterium indicum]BCM87908.1 plasmid partitioning protein RepB [Methylobacterium indicum]
MKRRDAIRDLYAPSPNLGKLTSVNPPAGTGTEQPTPAAAAEPASPSPDPKKLAAANSGPASAAVQAVDVGSEGAEQAPAPEKLAAANSPPNTEATLAAHPGHQPTSHTPATVKLTAVNSRSPDPSPDGRVPAGPVRAMSLSLSRMDDDHRALQAALARGQTIVDLDPALIEPSFVKDRLDHGAGTFGEFKRQIEEHGQEVPILVRPHPTRMGRYQVAYGHRRLRALTELGRQVRAVVRELNDADLVVAQGLENSARQDLSYIERALFACRLEDHGFERTIITNALSIDKGELSKLIAVARAVPEEIVTRIGPAPKIGRRRWLALAEHIKTPSVARVVEKAVMDDAFTALDSDARFARIAALVTPQKPSPASSKLWEGQGGQATAEISRKGATVTLAIDREPSFGEFVAARLDELYAAFLDQQASGARNTENEKGPGQR